MVYRDYHHHKLDEALADAENLISAVRMQGIAEDARIVTGYGVIREELFDLFKRYGLEPTYELGNQGVILVDIV